MSDSVKGGVKFILRMEGLGALTFALLAYARFGAGWGTFAWLFFAPDLSLLGYFAGPRIGAALYNSAHSYIGPLLLLGVGIPFALPIAIALGIIWAAHVGFDRALGYGLKYSIGFRFTHLGAIGRPTERA
jgi:hypothetical protein